MNIRFIAIIKKEFLHIARDFRSLVIIIVLPLAMIFIYGHAVKLDISEITLGVLDRSNSSASRELVNRFINTDYFVLNAVIHDNDDIPRLFKRREIKAALVIPPDFSESLVNNRTTGVQIIIDGSNSNTGTVIKNYTNMIISSYSSDRTIAGMDSPFTVEPRIWYNPDLDSANFIIPGLVAVILMMISALLTSITIVREKETGTMEQILVSPVRPLEIIFGKVLPYVLLAFIDGVIIVAAARFGFGVEISGSIVMLALLSIVYLYACLSIGLFISTRVRTQQVAMMLALVITILPSIILSGFMFPIRSMPIALRYLSHIVPAKYFLVIIRGIILKGNGFEQLWPQTLFLLILGTLLLFASVKRFKLRLE